MREIFIPKTRIPALPVDIEEYRNLYAGKKDLYVSVYTYRGLGKDAIKAQNAIVDKIFLDFDYDEDMEFFDDVRCVAKFLYEIGAHFKIRFSGRGFHLFVYLTDNCHNLKNPSKAIRGWVKDCQRLVRISGIFIRNIQQINEIFFSIMALLLTTY